MILASAAILVFGDSGREWLRYDSVWIGQGESWRLVSGHFAHLGVQHFVLNSIGLLLVWYLVGANFDRNAWLIVALVTLIVMDLAFWILKPGLFWYVGMSGLVHGLLSAGLIARWPNWDTESIVLALLIVVKILWEQFSGPIPGSEVTSGGPVVVDAHLYGAVGGFVGGVLAIIRARPKAAI